MGLAPAGGAAERPLDRRNAREPNNLAEPRIARETDTLASRSVLVVAPDLPDVPNIVLHRLSQ